MRWKLFTLLAVLALMVSTASPVKVKAQVDADVVGLVEIENLVVGIGTEQKLELHSYQTGGIYTITVTVVDDDTANGTCTETVQATVKEDSGLKTITIQMGAGNESLLINEEKVDLMVCFKPLAERVVLEVAKEFPDNRAGGQSSTRGFDPEFGLQFARPFSPVNYSIVNSDESTAASGMQLYAPGTRSFSIWSADGE
jgi:hypothetical protein